MCRLLKLLSYALLHLMNFGIFFTLVMAVILVWMVPSNAQPKSSHYNNNAIKSSGPRVYTPSLKSKATQKIKYYWRNKIPTTVFWIGERPTRGNPTPNHASSWDTKWERNYGGYDNPNPKTRSWDYRPKAFIPGENPFYIALPFNDLTNNGLAQKIVPWLQQGVQKTRRWKSICKGKWIAVRYKNRVCYAQWEDVGPFNTDDWAYVFGRSRPKNTRNAGAGLDVSPAIRDYLKMRSGALCDWKFVSISEIPPGPWRKYGRNNPFARQAKTAPEDITKKYERLRKQRDEAYRKSPNN